jgi:dephospho-CoA kinase
MLLERAPPVYRLPFTVYAFAMLSVALTGNIAAGKSTVSELFRRWGATVIDADALAREAQAPGTPVLAAIIARFGTEMLQPDGTLDRAALRRRVMGDQAALAALNAIVHPEVRRRRLELARAAAARGDRILVSEIPLLFEAADPTAFDAVVLVDAPVELRRQRLLQSRNLSRDEAERMLASQLPTEVKRCHSDYVIDNIGDLAALESAARAVWGALLAATK